MSEQVYKMPAEPEYHNAIRRLRRQDPGDAESVFNPLIQAMLENTHFVRKLAEAIAEQNAVDHGAIRRETATAISEAVGSIPTPDVSGQIGTHNTDSSAHEVRFQALAEQIESAKNGAVPTTREVNGKPLGTDVTLSAADVGAAPADHSHDEYASKASPVFTGSVSMGRKAETTVGAASVAEGTNVTASGFNSHAEGQKTVASEGNSHAEGWETVASGYQAHAEGQKTVASESNCHAEGYQTTASGYRAHAEGRETVASGFNSHAEGYQTTAFGTCAHVEGYKTSAGTFGAHAEGSSTVATQGADHAEGSQTIAADPDQILKVKSYNAATKTFVFDHSYGSFSDAFAKLEVGNQIYVMDTSYGGASEKFTIAAISAENNSITAAEDIPLSKFTPGLAVHLTTESGMKKRHAEGDRTIATGSNSHAEGQNTTAIGSNSHAEGWETVASGTDSHAGGGYTIASARCQTAIGYGNIESTEESDRLIIGKGHYSYGVFRANCFRVNDTGVFATGNYNSTGADYAELFEWLDGNPDGEDRAGRFVTLDGEKIRLAGPEDSFILGIISGAPSVVGDVHDEQWQGMYLYDIFGRPIWEDVEVPAETREYTIMAPVKETEVEQAPKYEVKTIPAHTERRQKLNPNYDRTQKYIPRTKRHEWGCVGMMGKLVVIDDGSCQVNGWCAPGQDGIATASAERTKYRVMSRLDDSHIRVLIL